MSDEEIRFEDVAIGQKFFDPFSGDFFIKVDDNEGETVDTGSAWDGERDSFEPDEIVILH